MPCSTNLAGREEGREMGKHGLTSELRIETGMYPSIYICCMHPPIFHPLYVSSHVPSVVSSFQYSVSFMCKLNLHVASGVSQVTTAREKAGKKRRKRRRGKKEGDQRLFQFRRPIALCPLYRVRGGGHRGVKGQLDRMWGGGWQRGQHIYFPPCVSFAPP